MFLIPLSIFALSLEQCFVFEMQYGDKRQNGKLVYKGTVNVIDILLNPSGSSCTPNKNCVLCSHYWNLKNDLLSAVLQPASNSYELYADDMQLYLSVKPNEMHSWVSYIMQK